MESTTMSNYHDESSGSRRLPYILAGSAIGGVIGFLFTTDRGKHFLRSARNMNAGDLQRKIEESRHYIEGKSRAVTERVHNVFERAQNALESGRQAYDNSMTDAGSPIKALENKNDSIVRTAHNTVDNMSRTVKSFGDSLVEPICELNALMRAVRSSLRSISRKDRESDTESLGESAPYLNERLG
jgi:hypothetical protein